MWVLVHITPCVGLLGPKPEMFAEKTRENLTVPIYREDVSRSSVPLMKLNGVNKLVGDTNRIAFFAFAIETCCIRDY